MPTLEEASAALRETLEQAYRKVAESWLPAKGRHDLWNLSGLDDPLLIQPPGVGKSFVAREVAERYFRERGIPTLYFVLEHDRADEMTGWAHWQGHGRLNCPEYARGAADRGKGYWMPFHCSCGYRSQFKTDEPTVAPLEHILYNDLDTLQGKLPEERRAVIPTIGKRSAIERFPIRIVDEINLSRFRGRENVSLEDMRFVADTYPDAHVRQLCDGLTGLMHEDTERLNGPALYERLREIVGSEFTGLLEGLSHAKLQDRKWWHDAAVPIPSNFPRYLVPIVLSEARSETGSYNPRVHVVPGELRIGWRKEAANYIPTIVMDASADPTLLSKVFGEVTRPPHEIDVPLPQSVTVYQYLDARAGKTTVLGSRDRWYKRLRVQLDVYTRDSTIGIITFKEIESEAATEIRSMGFDSVRSLHYYNLRSDNSLKDVDVLILLGCPSPRADELLEDAQAFLWDEPTLKDTSWTSRRVMLPYKGGKAYADVGGFYGEPLLNAYYRQTAQEELYQAFHRARPLRGTRPLDIIIFTNVPIPGVQADHLIRETGHVERERRFEQAVAFIQDGLAQTGECRSPDLQHALGLSRDWVSENAETLAEMADCRYESRLGRGGSRFVP